MGAYNVTFRYAVGIQYKHGEAKMTMTKLQAALALAALGAWSALAAANFPVGTHIIKGSVMGYDEYGRNVLLKPDSEVVIRAVNTNGQIIAESKIIEATADGINFVLRIPLSSTATDSTCAVGDKLNCVMSQASGALISTEPVTVGGALAVNAGTGGQGILDVAEQVVWVDENGEVRTTAHSELDYGYRRCETFQGGVIVSALLKGYRSTTEHIRQKRSELHKKREQSQPKGKTLGCFFKNPPSCSAGQLLEQCGAKGKREGEIFVSAQHANFIMNGGNGRFDDVIRLVKSLRTAVHERSGVWLEPEVRILGRHWDEFL